MTTESTSIPSTPGPWTAAGQGSAPGLASLAPPRGTPGRTASPPRRAPRPPRPVAPLLAADGLAVLLAACLVPDPHRGPLLFLLVAGCVCVFHAHAGLYRPGPRASALDELPALAARAGFAWCLAAAVFAAYGPTAIGPGPLGAAYAAHLTAGCLLRGLVHAHGRRTHRSRPRSALVIGGAGAAHRFASAVGRHPEYGLRPVGIVGPRADIGSPQPGAEPGLPVLSTTEEIHRAVIQNAVRDAVFLSDDAALVTLFQQYGCTTWRVGDGRHGGPMSDHLWGYGFRRLVPPAERRGRTAKRVLDLAVGVPALMTVLPLLLGCALAVRLSDGPGVLFRQERVGQNGRLFTLLKFRTLRPSDETESATRWSVADDRRMSPVGSFLRRSSLDELPQLWNVLRGDMSLVGPRPERPYFVARFSRIHPGYAARHRMPVGLTGLAQVHGLRGDTSIEDRCRFDNHYIDHWSLWQDVRILLRTAAGLVRPAGS
ncbi:sugar transferase [Streptomyces sp. NBC_01216]|uniref:sugar transferase n=1 Tax=unclassified Streptomyces TaxID=2593676 RepID=UPI002E133151|nr:sugar transferase [Streptomyces sp. NBC_01216]